MAQPETPPGQEKMHPITNGTVTVMISQEDWKEHGEELKAQGWYRVEGGAPEVNPLKT